MQFRKLDTDEEQEFRKWARDNYTAGAEVKPLWHPVVREECERINVESMRTGNADMYI